MFNTDEYDKLIEEAQRIIDKYKTPDACKNEQELNELEGATEVLAIDELSRAARRTCEVDG